MNHYFFKLWFLFIGNICKWAYYSGKKSFDEVSKEDNELLGIIVSVFFGFILYFCFQ
jgi:hypothetical protein